MTYCTEYYFRFLHKLPLFPKGDQNISFSFFLSFFQVDKSANLALELTKLMGSRFSYFKSTIWAFGYDSANQHPKANDMH
jgi:hypothetical protein